MRDEGGRENAEVLNPRQSLKIESTGFLTDWIEDVREEDEDGSWHSGPKK